MSPSSLFIPSMRLIAPLRHQQSIQTRADAQPDLHGLYNFPARANQSFTLPVYFSPEGERCGAGSGSDRVRRIGAPIEVTRSLPLPALHRSDAINEVFERNQ